MLQEEVHERTRVNLEKKRSQAQEFIDRFGAKATKAAQAQSRQKMLQRVPVLEKLKAIYQLDFHFNEAPFFGKTMLDAQQLSFAYPPVEGPLLIDQLSLSIENREKIAIIGKNGRGKSTLLRLLAGELVPLAGSLKRADPVRIGYFGQTNIDRLHPQHTIEEEIGTANRALTRTEVKGICGLMMFSGDQANKRTSILSGGEKSRVLLGKILATPCNLLLLDEPTHHLDMESVEALIDALEEFQGAVVLVTHSELILKRLVLDKLVVCHSGRQELFCGSYVEFLERDGWHDAGEAVKPKRAGERQVVRRDVGARALKLLDREIAGKEELVTRLEVEQQAAHGRLAEASERRDNRVIEELGREIAARGREIDALYDQLEALMRSRDAAGGQCGI